MQVNILSVLERKPLSPIQRRVLVLATLAIVLEGFDIQIVAFTAPSILAEWGIAKSTLGLVMAAALVGMAIGAAVGGYLGDRLGRRAILISSIVLFGVPTLASALSTNVTQLTLLRAVAGIGFGAALPNAAALVAEFMPDRIRAQSVALVVIGVPAGGMVGADLASWLVPAFGWRCVFIVGGCLPLALALAMTVGLPESLRFLVRRGGANAVIAGLLQRIAGMEFSPASTFVFERESALEKPAAEKDSPTILTRELRRVNAGLWLAFLSSLACGYAFFSWIPTALAALALPLDVAIRGSFYFNLFGVVGALTGSWLVTRIGSRAALLLLLSMGIVATLALGLWLTHAKSAGLVVQAAYLMIPLSFAGASNVGAQAALYALAASAYPTHCRATGIGWSASVGRIGAIMSAYGGGAVLALGSGPSTFFMSLSILLGIAMIGVLIVDRHTGRLVNTIDLKLRVENV